MHSVAGHAPMRTGRPRPDQRDWKLAAQRQRSSPRPGDHRRRTPDSDSRETAQLVRAQTALDGSFFFGNLPAGDYRFCLAHLGSYLNPCEWPSKNDLGRVTLGGSDPKLRLRADPGRRVSLKLNDVSGALQRPLATGKLPEPVVLVVDRAGKIWRRIMPSSTDGVTFSDLVPDDSTYGFAVGNTDLAFGDDSGKSLAAKAFIPFAPKLTADQRASLRLMHHRDPDDPPTVVHVLGAR